jgi:HTH-type transcriptional regulator/antitoxin HipB
MYVKTPMDVGHLVKDKRKKLGLTQELMAKKLGVSRLWLLQLEQGKTTVHLGMVLRALNDLGIMLEVDTSASSSVLREESARMLDDIIQRSSKKPKP